MAIIREEKVIYLILQFGYPTEAYSQPIEHIAAYELAANELGITVLKVDVGRISRYSFYFPDYQRNDEVANHIGEALVYAANLISGPMADLQESNSEYAIPYEVVKESRKVDLQILINVEEMRGLEFKELNFPTLTLGSASFLDDHDMAASWKITPHIHKNMDFFNAARYFKESQDSFFVYPGQYDDLIYDSESYFKSGWEQNQQESALLNSFKAIEGLVGVFPSRDHKLINKIQNLGIDPNLEFGLSPKLPLYLFLRQMEKARNQSSAHGKKTSKEILVRDLFLYQGCARFILMLVLQHKLKDNILPRYL
ncbi:MAG: hypothetical protein ABFC86_00750 [Rectinema sp.]